MSDVNDGQWRHLCYEATEMSSVCVISLELERDAAASCQGLVQCIKP